MSRHFHLRTGLANYKASQTTEELSLEVEVRATEEGMGFWEHYKFKDGECLCDDCGDLPSSQFDMEDVA